MTRAEAFRLGGALLLGAALAFPAAFILAGQEERKARAHAPSAARGRAMYSPDVRGDPYVLDQLRRQVEALEAHCRRTGEMCVEAHGARNRYAELAAEQ